MTCRRGRWPDGACGGPALREDPGTEVILFVSKPPAPEVAAAVLAAAGEHPGGRRADRAGRGFAGRRPGSCSPTRWNPACGHAAAARRRRAGHDRDARAVGAAAAVAAGTRADPGARPVLRRHACATSRWSSWAGPRGGSLQHPDQPGWGLPAPAGSHQCLDLGEEEYTRGRPHPMIDAEARHRVARASSGGPARGGDHPRVVLGYGANPTRPGTWRRRARR